MEPVKAIQRRVLRAYRDVAHDALSRNLGLDTGEETATQQHFKEDADVNVIMRRFGVGGAPSRGGGVYGDFSGIHDYESALAAIERAEAGFMALPAEVRAQFGNDPAMLLRATPEQLDAVNVMLAPKVEPGVSAQPEAPAPPEAE